MSTSRYMHLNKKINQITVTLKTQKKMNTENQPEPTEASYTYSEWHRGETPYQKAEQEKQIKEQKRQQALNMATLLNSNSDRPTCEELLTGADKIYQWLIKEL